MLAWLNANIGADWATYLGTFLGFISILGMFIGGKQLIKKSNVNKSQKSGKNSKQYMSDGNMYINADKDEKADD